MSDLDRQLVRIRTVEPYGKPLEYISIPRAVEYLAVAENKVFGITQGGLYIFDADNIKRNKLELLRMYIMRRIRKLVSYSWIRRV